MRTVVLLLLPRRLWPLQHAGQSARPLMWPSTTRCSQVGWYLHRTRPVNSESQRHLLLLLGSSQVP
jgi:hypothetical protein